MPPATPGHLTRAQRAPTSTADLAPPTWDNNDPIVTFDDGWAIYALTTQNDREAQHACQPIHCVDRPVWEQRIADGLRLFSLRDADGFAQATINCGEANYILKCRAGSEYVAYTSSKCCDQTPRCLNGEPVICLEIAPPGRTCDPTLSHEISKRVAEWYEALPIPDDLADFCGSLNRTELAAKLRERGIQNPVVV